MFSKLVLTFFVVLVGLSGTGLHVLAVPAKLSPASYHFICPDGEYMKCCEYLSLTVLEDTWLTDSNQVGGQASTVSAYAILLLLMDGGYHLHRLTRFHQRYLLKPSPIYLFVQLTAFTNLCNIAAHRTLRTLGAASNRDHYLPYQLSFALSNCASRIRSFDTQVCINRQCSLSITAS